MDFDPIEIFNLIGLVSIDKLLIFDKLMVFLLLSLETFDLYKIENFLSWF